MKEMEYKRSNESHVVLDCGKICGIKYAIISFGTHPAAYIENVLKVNSYDDESLNNIRAHGGFTYLGKAFWDETDSAEYLGWDYAHFGDFTGYLEHLPDDYHQDCYYYTIQLFQKCWKTEEIKNEVKNVIKQIATLIVDKSKKYWRYDKGFTLNQAKQLKIGEHFYFGEYNCELIEWIKVADDRAISTYILDDMAFGKTNDYDTSNIRNWCNTLCHTMDLENDTIYIPSNSELIHWFPDDILRECDYSIEAKNRGIDDGAPWYWTSTPASHWYSHVGCVRTSGAFRYLNTNHSLIGARPALKLGD